MIIYSDPATECCNNDSAIHFKTHRFQPVDRIAQNRGYQLYKKNLVSKDMDVHVCKSTWDYPTLHLHVDTN